MSPGPNAPGGSGHPTLLLGGDALKRPFPLVLCIGLEAKTGLPIVPGVGQYDVRRIPNVSFWHTSHGIAACVNGQRPCDFLNDCATRDASPLAYADGLPLGILKDDPDKRAKRRSVTPGQVDRHVDEIFSPEHEAVVRRILLVLLSGLDGKPNFRRSVAAIQDRCNRLKIPCVHVPFFMPENTLSILDALDSGPRAVITFLLARFCEH